MKTTRRSRAWMLVLLALAAGTHIVHPVSAVTINIADGPAQIYLRIGQASALTNRVTFDYLNVPGAFLGDGTPIPSTSTVAAGAASGGFAACPTNNIRIIAQARDNAALNRTAALYANSKDNPLNGGGGRTIPFSDISWTSDEPTFFPSGTFDESTSQKLLEFSEPLAVGACIRFYFKNDKVYAAGAAPNYRYDGRVQYTLSMP